MHEINRDGTGQRPRRSRPHLHPLIALHLGDRGTDDVAEANGRLSGSAVVIARQNEQVLPVTAQPRGQVVETEKVFEPRRVAFVAFERLDQLEL